MTMFLQVLHLAFAERQAYVVYEITQELVDGIVRFKLILTVLIKQLVQLIIRHERIWNEFNRNQMYCV
jgi:hypothetical protein